MAWARYRESLNSLLMQELFDALCGDGIYIIWYMANFDSPIFEEMKSLLSRINSQNKPVRAEIMAKTAGLSDSMGNSRIIIPQNKLNEFCRRNHIGRLSLFGSVLRDDFRPDSDVDVMVEFEPGKTPGFFKLADMETELSELIDRKVDLRTPQDLSRYFRDKVVKEAEVQYSAT